MNKYPIELLNLMTELVSRVKIELLEEGCSFDEACNVAGIVFRKFISKEIVPESLKALLPDLLNQVRDEQIKQIKSITS